MQLKIKTTDEEYYKEIIKIYMEENKEKKYKIKNKIKKNINGKIYYYLEIKSIK